VGVAREGEGGYANDPFGEKSLKTSVKITQKKNNFESDPENPGFLKLPPFQNPGDAHDYKIPMMIKVNRLQLIISGNFRRKTLLKTDLAIETKTYYYSIIYM
jgi:hypothetical protein